MERRGFVASVGSVLCTLLLPGCAGSSVVTGPRTITRDSPNSDGELQAREIYYNLEDEDSTEITVERLAIDGDVMRLRYSSPGQTQRVFLRELSHVAQLWAGYQEQERPVDTLEVVVLDEFGDRRASYVIEASWADTYNSGDVSFERYVQKVVQENVDRSG